MTPYYHDDAGSLEALVRAVWAAGFRAGKQSGEANATACEWGSRSHEPQTPEEAWNVHVEWWLKVESRYAINTNNLEAWDSVP